MRAYACARARARVHATSDGPGARGWARAELYICRRRGRGYPIAIDRDIDRLLPPLRVPARTTSLGCAQSASSSAHGGATEDPKPNRYPGPGPIAIARGRRPPHAPASRGSDAYAGATHESHGALELAIAISIGRIHVPLPPQCGTTLHIATATAGGASPTAQSPPSRLVTGRPARVDTHVHAAARALQHAAASAAAQPQLRICN